MSSYRNETRRKDSYNRYNSNQVGKERSNKEFRNNHYQTYPSNYFPRTHYAGPRQQHEIRPRHPDESKWNDQRHSRFSNFRKTLTGNQKVFPQQGPGIGAHSKDLLYQGQNLNKSNWLSMRSQSGSSGWERYSKESKGEYQVEHSSSEQKAEQPAVRSGLQSFEQRKSDSPPPSHRKPEQKQFKNRSKIDKHKNSLDESSLHALQKAQLVADSNDEVLPLPYTSPFGSSKIVYMLDSEERIQYSIKSDHPAVVGLGDARMSSELSSDDRQSRGLMSQAHSVNPQSQAHSVNPSSQAHSVNPSSQAHSVNPSSQAHSVNPSSQAHSVNPSSQAHSVNPQSQAHSVNPSSQAHSVNPSSQTHSVNRPSQAHSVNRPSQAHSVNSSSQAHTVNPSSQTHSVNRPSQAHSVNRPSQGHSVNPQSQGHSVNRPSQAHSVNRPSQAHSVNPPSQAHSVNPSSQAHTVNPSSQAHSVNPQAHSVNPPSQAHSVNPPSQAHSVNPPSQAHSVNRPSWTKASRSPGSESPDSHWKDHQSKIDRSMGREKLTRKFETREQDKVQAAMEADTCASRYWTTPVSVTFVKMKSDVLQASLITRKARSRSSSSSSSSGERQHQQMNKMSDAPTPGCHSRSGSESPSQLRAALLEQRRRNIEAQQGKSLQTRNVYESNQQNEPTNVGKCSPVSENASNIEYSYHGNRRKSSSSSPEPPPVIPRVHLSRFEVLSAGRVPGNWTSQTVDVSKAANKRHPLSAPTIFSRQLSSGELSLVRAVSNQTPVLSTHDSVPEDYATSTALRQLSSGELPSAWSLPNRQPDFASAQTQSKMLTENICSISPRKLFPLMPQPKLANNKQASLSMQDNNQSIMEESGVSVKDIPVPSGPHKLLSRPYFLSVPSISKTTTSQPALPTNTSLSAVVEQPLSSVLPVVDHAWLPSVPLPGETCAHTTTGMAAITKTEESNRKEGRLFSGQKSPDNTSAEQEEEKTLIRYKGSSFSSSAESKITVDDMKAEFIARTGEKEFQEMESQLLALKEDQVDASQEISQNVAPSKWENNRQTGIFQEDRFKRISNRHFEERKRFNESETSRSDRAASSSSRKRRRSRNRSKSVEKRYAKKSPDKQQSSSRRHKRSSPGGRTSSHSQRSPPRSSWKSHGVHQCDKSPPRRRSHERHRRGKRRTKSRSKSRSNHRSSRRLSSTSSSD